MRTPLLFVFAAVSLAACGPRDACVAPAAIKPVSVKDLTLVEKADALGVPPSRVPVEPRAAGSYGALMAGMADNEAAKSVYEAYVDHRNAALRQGYCVDNEAYKARRMKDEMGVLAHAVMATCHSNDEPAALAAILRFRNCAAGNT